MPFVAGTKCRIWSAVNQKFLVAKKDGTEGNGSSKSQLKITCAGKEDEDASKSQLFIFVVSTCTQLVTCLAIKTRQSIV